MPLVATTAYVPVFGSVELTFGVGTVYVQLNASPAPLLLETHFELVGVVESGPIIWIEFTLSVSPAPMLNPRTCRIFKHTAITGAVGVPLTYTLPVHALLGGAL